MLQRHETLVLEKTGSEQWEALPATLLHFVAMATSVFVRIYILYYYRLYLRFEVSQRYDV